MWQWLGPLDIFQGWRAERSRGCHEWSHLNVVSLTPEYRMRFPYQISASFQQQIVGLSRESLKRTPMSSKASSDSYVDCCPLEAVLSVSMVGTTAALMRYGTVWCSRVRRELEEPVTRVAQDWKTGVIVSVTSDGNFIGHPSAATFSVVRFFLLFPSALCILNDSWFNVDIGYWGISCQSE